MSARGYRLLGELVSGWVGALARDLPPIINVNRDRSPVRCQCGLEELRLGTVAEWEAILTKCGDRTDDAAQKMRELATAKLTLLRL